MKKLRVLDLFAGIGGFHLGFKKSDINFEIVAASEIDKDCIEVYKENFPDTPIIGDIRENWNKLPEFDMLTAGFPCQPFSRAGNRLRENDERGNYFELIIKILENNPNCNKFILENVPSFFNEEIKKNIKEKMDKLNFKYEILHLSPHEFGGMQKRERTFVVGYRGCLRFNSVAGVSCNCINSMLNVAKNFQFINKEKVMWDYNPIPKYQVKNTRIIHCWIRFWEQFIKGKDIRFPIWIDYFKTEDSGEFPRWKRIIIEKNRKLYLENKEYIDIWLKFFEAEKPPKSLRKFEYFFNDVWNKDVKLQFRSSGMRARKDYFPTIVSMPSNIPICKQITCFNEVVWGYLSPRQCAILQGFPEDFKIHENDNKAYKQIGNAVHSDLVKLIIEAVI